MAASPPALPLHTSGSYIVDSNGARVHLNGVNWYGAESPDYVVAGLQVASLSAIVQQIKNLGFNVVRLPWSNQLYETNPVVGDYALGANPTLKGENALTIFDQVIDALTSAGIMVILDNHNSNAEWCCSTTDGNSLWYNSQYTEGNWIADWQGMAQRYRNNPWVIGTDLRNELRGTATWGSNSATDWHAAAERGGNAVLSVNPNLLIFVEGVNYARDLSGAGSLPVQLNVPGRLVYEAHSYGVDYSGLTGYSHYVAGITPRWGYLVTGANPQPLWIGEFGTCNTADTCIDSGSASDKGYWFSLLTAYIQQYGVDWTYWAVNGTHSTGGSSSYGSPETFGVLNAAWNGSANTLLTTRLQSMISPAAPNFMLIGNGSATTIAAGQNGSTTITIVPENGFTGAINLSCSVSSSTATASMPTCCVSSPQSITGNSAVSTGVSISTAELAAKESDRAAPDCSHVAVLFCALLFVGIPASRRKVFLSFLAVVLVTLTLSSCGGGASSNAAPLTLASGYTVTVTGTASGLSPVTGQIAVTVQ